MKQTKTTPGGKRTILAEVLPLETPFMIQIFPVYGCNFKCSYCIHAVEREKRGYISDIAMMDFNLYKKAIDDMKQFPGKIKMLRFAGIGEPLLHKNIDDMISYAKQADIANSLDIVTNASLLTPNLSDSLIKAGLSKLRISLEGLNEKDYFNNCGAMIDFENLVKNIGYFYENRGNTKVYIKIIDYMLKSKEDEKKFFDLFEPICDEIAIEHLTPTVKEIDYDKIADNLTTEKAQNGEKLLQANICPQPFYLMQINPDGNIVPCCSMHYPGVFGNVKTETVMNIWHGKKLKQFRGKLLQGNDKVSLICAECNLYLYGMYEEDVLDKYAENLSRYYK